MTDTFSVSISEKFRVWPCARCGLRFGVPQSWADERYKDGGSIFCPNGHSMSYGESEADRVRRERDRLKQQLAQKDDEIRGWIETASEKENQRRRVEAAKKRLERRVNNGVCPCCTRSFQNLKRHMATKHPNVVDFKAA